jgi:tRNA (uracil-5-)-methyltransferase
MRGVMAAVNSGDSGDDTGSGDNGGENGSGGGGEHGAGTTSSAADADADALRRRLYQVNIHTTLAGDAMVTLVYHRQLDGAWRDAAGRLQARLADALAQHRRQQQQQGEQGQQQQPQQQQQQPPGALHIIGRSRKQKVVLGADHVTERLSVNGRELMYRQVEGAFSQPNAGVAAQMLAWAQDVTGGSLDRDLLELYCGNGNFTVALAPRFRQVVATEVATSSVEACRVNLSANGAGNVFVARMSAAEFTETWRAKGTRNRLKGLAPWDELRLRTLLVDPPRAGLDDESRKLLADFDAVVYVSCNPETLARDLESIKATHKIERLALFDQFPYTHHVEMGAYVVRR